MKKKNNNNKQTTRNQLINLLIKQIDKNLGYVL